MISDPLVSKIAGFFKYEININIGETIVCAVSGGVDSVTMLHVLNTIGNVIGFKLIVAHYNHKLRNHSSESDEKFVGELAQQMNLPFFTSSSNVKHYAEKYSLSIEEAARNLRYKFLEKLAKQAKCSYVATAHTANDRAETLLINLFRGSGLTGLSSIPNKRPLADGITIIRPLLGVDKSDLISYSKSKGIKWKEDETNKLMLYTRNKVRNKLLPELIDEYNPSIILALNKTADLIGGADRFIANHVTIILKSIIENSSTKHFSMKLNLFKSLDDFIKGEIIQKAVTNFFKIPPLSMNSIDRIISIANSLTGSIYEINSQIMVLKDRELLVFSKKSPQLEFDLNIDRVGEYKANNLRLSLTEVDKKQVKFTKDPNIEYFDMDLIPAIINFRTWKQGDSFSPIGMEGTMLVSDFLTNSKVSLLDKSNVAVLATRTDIIWLCGRRSCNKFKVTPDTRQFLRAEFKNVNKEKVIDNQPKNTKQEK